MIGLPELMVLMFLFGVIGMIIFAVVLVKRYNRRKNNPQVRP
jgi:hypothetical protein